MVGRGDTKPQYMYVYKLLLYFSGRLVIHLREKGRYLTQSFEKKSPYTHKKSKKQHDNVKTL